MTDFTKELKRLAAELKREEPPGDEDDPRRGRPARLQDIELGPGARANNDDVQRDARMRQVQMRKEMLGNQPAADRLRGEREALRRDVRGRRDRDD